jgi:hypothetical protein
MMSQSISEESAASKGPVEPCFEKTGLIADDEGKRV